MSSFYISRMHTSVKNYLAACSTPAVPCKLSSCWLETENFSSCTKVNPKPFCFGGERAHTLRHKSRHIHNRTHIKVKNHHTELPKMIETQSIFYIH